MIVLMFIKKLLLLTLRLFLLNLLEFKNEINALMQLETGLKEHIDSYSQQSKFNEFFERWQYCEIVGILKRWKLL